MVAPMAVTNQECNIKDMDIGTMDIENNRDEPQPLNLGISTEASPAILLCYTNLNHHYSFLYTLIPYTVINTEKFAFAGPNAGLASPLKGIANYY